MQHLKSYLITIDGTEDKSTDEENKETNSLNIFKDGIINRILELAGKKDETGMPLSVSDIVLHIMTNSDAFDLSSRRATGIELTQYAA